MSSSTPLHEQLPEDATQDPPQVEADNGPAAPADLQSYTSDPGPLSGSVTPVFCSAESQAGNVVVCTDEPATSNTAAAVEAEKSPSSGRRPSHSSVISDSNQHNAAENTKTNTHRPARSSYPLPQQSSTRRSRDAFRRTRFEYLDPEGVERSLNSVLADSGDQSDHSRTYRFVPKAPCAMEAEGNSHDREDDDLERDIQADAASELHLEQDHQVQLVEQSRAADIRRHDFDDCRDAALVPLGNRDLTMVHVGRQETSTDSYNVLMDAIALESNATKYADLCFYNMRAFKRRARSKELLCIANIKHRYGSRPSYKILGPIKAVMSYFYPTPRQQKKLTKETAQLIQDWDQLIQRYELVERLATALFKEARLNHRLDCEAESRSNTQTHTEEQGDDEHANGNGDEDDSEDRFTMNTKLDLSLPRTTRVLISDAALHLKEIRVQDSVIGRRGESLDAKWHLLLTQLKQLDQVDLLRKDKSSGLG